MTLTALAALTLLWSPVTLDCLGGAESGVVYEVAYLYRECHPIPGCVECDGCPDCDECSTFAVRFETRETRWETELGDDPPQVGAGYFYEVRDRDGAGNRQEAACP